MEAALLRKLAVEHLRPLFSGAEIQADPFPSTAAEQCVAYEDPCTILFKLAREDLYRLSLRRSQMFDSDGGGRVNEKRVVQAFVDVAREIEQGLAAPYGADLLSTFQHRVVVKAIGLSEVQGTLLAAIDQLSVWATRLYEGKPIAAIFGFEPNVQGGNVTLHDICLKDFSSVLSNGFDTMFTFDFDGALIGHETLPQPALTPSFSPYRQGPVAAWAGNGRIALALNRLGEILVFIDEKLLFARRSGKWHFLTHEPVLTQMGRPADVAVRKAVYESCLDASFARTGACIGVVTSGHIARWKDIAPKPDDYMGQQQSAKSRTLARLIGTRPFQQLDRRFRQELLAIDGATLLNHKGFILAVGAILHIEGCSTGGGRLAAARTLSKLGLGIKVSQDGGILGFQDDDEEPKFAVM